MPTGDQLIQVLASSDADLTSFCRLFDWPTSKDFPRPGAADGKSPTELADAIKEVGFCYERDTAHSHMYKHELFPNARVGIALTSGDRRGGRPVFKEARKGYLEEVRRLHSALVALVQLTIDVASLPRGGKVGIPEDSPLAFVREAVLHYAEDNPPGENRELPTLDAMRTRWHLDEMADHADEIISIAREMERDVTKAKASQVTQPAEIRAALKSATLHGADVANDIMRKLRKEFGLSVRKCLEYVGVPDDHIRGIAKVLEAPDAIFPESSAAQLESYLQELREAKKQKKKTSGRAFAAKTVNQKTTALDALESRLKKLPTMDMLNIISDQILALKTRQHEREKLLREALQEQVGRAEEAEAALRPFQDKVVELAKSAEIEAERADDLADKLDEAQAAATANSEVQKLISDLHVAVDGFRVKHAQADLERIEEILLGFQVETGIEAEVKA